ETLDPRQFLGFANAFVGQVASAFLFLDLEVVAEALLLLLRIGRRHMAAVIDVLVFLVVFLGRLGGGFFLVVLGLRLLLRFLARERMVGDIQAVAHLFELGLGLSFQLGQLDGDVVGLGIAGQVAKRRAGNDQRCACLVDEDVIDLVNDGVV